MAEEAVFSAEGAASINEADASPKPAFEDMKSRLSALGMSDEDVHNMVMAYCKERTESPMSTEDAYKLAFRCVVAQWVTRLVRFGGYTYAEMSAVFGEFGEGLARNTTGKLPTPRETAISSLSSLYYSLRVRGVSDEELLAATRSLAKNALDVEEDSHEGMKGFSGVGAAQALADNLASIRRYGLADEDLEPIGKLQTEAGRTTDDIAHEALDTFYAYMTVSGYSGEDIQSAVAGILA